MATKKEKQELRDMADEVHRRVALARVEAKEDWRRNHYGASIMGRKCDRYKWQSFHWAKDPQHDARMLRLFAHGHAEENVFVAELRAAGYEVIQPDGSERFRFKEGHIGGEGDGLILDFLGDGDDALLECKTHSERSFTRLVTKKSVKQCKPEHYTQVNVYMHKLGLKWALYVACNKNNSELYYEIIPYDEKHARKALSEARNLVVNPNVPEKMDDFFAPCVLISKEGKKYPCDYHGLCHGNLEVLPERNCRTCMEATATQSGEWRCEHHDRALSVDEQKAGCRDHLYHPGLLNADITSASKEDRVVEYQHASGATFKDSRDVPQEIKDLVGDRGKVTKSGKSTW